MPDTSDFVPDFDILTSVVSLTQNRSTLVCGNASQRFALFLCGNSTAQVWLSPAQMTAQNQGLNLPSSGTNLVLNFRDHGAIVCSNWYAFTTVIGASIAVFEVVYRQRSGSQ